MARLARAVAVAFPHHVTQRGNRRQRTFFSEDHYRRYLELLAKWPAHFGLEVWAYCLMPNHVHLIVTPRKPEALARGIGDVHRRYTWAVNRERGWRGFLWQGRFASYILGDTYLLNATRYALRNPVEARRARESSVRCGPVGRSPTTRWSTGWRSSWAGGSGEGSPGRSARPSAKRAPRSSPQGPPVSGRESVRKLS